LLSIDVLNPYPYWSGMNIYGNTLSGSSLLDFNITIKNLSSNPQVFKYNMKYISNLSSTEILENGTTLSIAANGTSTLTGITHVRPAEQNFGIPYYEEFTTWKVIFELLDSNDNNLDNNDNTTFDVYNNLINFNLSNPTVTDGFTAPHYVNNNLTYTIDVEETNDRLTNIPYNAYLYMENSGGTGDYNLLSTVSGTMTHTKTISFNNINTPTFSLPYNSSDVRDIKFVIEHEYDIEGLTKTTGHTFITTTGLTVNRAPEPANFLWVNPPTIPMTKGTCNTFTGIFSGDAISGSTVTIVNSGGTFNGSVTVTFYWRQDAVNIASTTMTLPGPFYKNIPQTFTAFMGPNDSLGNPYVTYTNKNYTIRVTTLKISGSLTSVPKVGYWDSYPDCTP